MLAINNYTQEYVDDCRRQVAAQVAAYRKMVSAARKHAGAGVASVDAAITSFEPEFFNNLVVVLESLFVHRLRGKELKDGNPLNEVRMLTASLLTHGGVMTADSAIKMKPESSVLGYQFGDEIMVTGDQFDRLAAAFFADIERKYV